MLCVCYCIPSNSTRSGVLETDTLDRVALDMAELNQNECTRDFILCGDMNSRTGCLSDYVENDNGKHLPLPDGYIEDESFGARSNMDININTRGRQLIEFCQQCNLRILNGRTGQDMGVGKLTCFKYNGSSCVDYIMCSPALYKEFVCFEVGDPNIYSDHCWIDFSLSVGQKPEAARASAKSYKFKWDETKRQDYINVLMNNETIESLELIKREIQEGELTADKVNHGVNSFVSALTEIAEPLFLKCSSSTYQGTEYRSEIPVWANDEYVSARCKYFEASNRHKSSPSSTNRVRLVEARKEFKHISRKCRKHFDNNETKKLLTAKFNNARDYWKLLKGTFQTSSPNISIEHFKNYFENLSNPNDYYQPIDNLEGLTEDIIFQEMQNTFDELNISIVPAEIQIAIRQLKTNRSGGDDLLLNEFFTAARDFLTPNLVVIFNAIFNSGIFPEAWTTGLLIPLHKKGNIHSTDNYRGITLLSVLGKIFTHVLNNRLTKWAEDYGIYVEAQGGFRAGRGTTDNMFILENIIYTSINSGNTLYTAFIDFSKAFDYVVRDNLWYKLLKYLELMVRCLIY